MMTYSSGSMIQITFQDSSQLILVTMVYATILNCLRICMYIPE